MPALPQTRYSPEEYLAIEREAEYKSEYVNGQIYALAGASVNHYTITSNLNRELSNQFKGRPCRVFASDLRIKVIATGLYAYPDIVATRDELSFDDIKRDTIVNPMVIIEVLSPSTEAFDRGTKFAHYRRLDSLQEYVLVAQDQIRIEHYSRNGEQWVLTEISDLADTLKLESIGCELLLRDIYDKVDFENEITITEGQL